MQAPLLDINENQGEGGGGEGGAAGEDPGPGPSGLGSPDLRRRQNLDIALLSRHIDHMQRICRASLTDLTLSRQRRQIIRLQGIRRMLEDLQRQIRELQAGGGEQDPVVVPGSSAALLAPVPASRLSRA